MSENKETRKLMLTNKIWFIIINNILELKIGHKICLRKLRHSICVSCREKSTRRRLSRINESVSKKELLYVEYHKKS